MSQDKINGKITNIELQMIIDDMKRTLPFQIQGMVLDAELMFKRYNSLKNAGFSDSEALEIIKARGTSL